jgi:sigma-E factor negative regulatory protein RseC
MENPRGTVLSVVENGPASYAIVEVSAGFRCERCESGKGCGAGLFGSRQGQRQTEALIAPGMHVSAGDRVSIELAPRNLLRASLLVYGLPLAGAVGGAALAYLSGFGDAGGAIAALAGAGAGLLAGRYRLRQAGCLKDLTPSIAACLPRQDP